MEVLNWPRKMTFLKCEQYVHVNQSIFLKEILTSQGRMVYHLGAKLFNKYIVNMVNKKTGINVNWNICFQHESNSRNSFLLHDFRDFRS